MCERTKAEYEEELCQAKEENERQHEPLDSIFRTHQVLSLNADVQRVICRLDGFPLQSKGESSTLKQEEPQHAYVKEEKEELCITQEETDLINWKLTGVPVKTEDKPQEFSQPHHSPSEEDRGIVHPSSCAPQHITEVDGGHCEESEAYNLLAPLSDNEDTLSAPEDEQRLLNSNTDCQGDMRTQIENKHSECSEKKMGKKGLLCSVCAKSFFHSWDLTRHMRTHKGEKPYSCSVCSKRFSRNDILIQHKFTHTGEKPFVCSVCGKSFSAMSSMVSHMRIHTGEKPYSCLICSKSFSQHSSLTAHKRTHTGEKPFSCSVCDKRFSTKSNMVNHMRTHTREKRFCCNICGKMLIKKVSLIEHQRTHTGEKPFSCSVCGKKFTSNPNRVKHMRIHTGEKPFSCSICATAFARNDYLMAHMQTHNR
ncbi:oocyte zinc finger protein XlCOF6.1-like [Nerophis ophidion]|uniref:oocyte zinc finger protein XlCOF6.1-like n=1 Tax=Nerophis ophidion TaxID=159077 RepID=UPI002AE0494B|nr:oocyte zinc finger protein XlCOF6.1-like [Nerophis ophidion]